MITKRQGRGAAGPAALGLLPVVGLVLGLLLVAVALLRQVPDPPRPVSTPTAQGVATTTAPPGEGGGAVPEDPAPEDPAPQDAVPQDPASEDAAPGVAAETAAPGAEAATPTGTPDDLDPLPPSEPVQVRVPAIGVASPLHALGLAEDGTLEVPSGALVDQAAWYSGSPTPGEAGPSVLEGHVTGPGGRPSVFFELGALTPGDRVEVDRADGGTVVFEVYAVDSFPKDQFPTVAVYGPTAGPELRLITCGGEFDDATGHHVDNTVVFARVVADTA